MRVARFAVALSLVVTVAVAEDKTTHVDVVVTDARGKAIRGLTAADFEAVRAGSASAVASAAEVTDPAPRRILILFDNSSLTLAHRRQVANSLKSWIDANVRSVDAVAIAASNPSLRQVLDWSSDKAAIVTALDTATRDAGNYLEQERRRAEQLMQDTLQRGREVDAMGNRATYRPSFDELMRVGRTYAASQYRDVDSVVSAVGAAMTWFTRASGKRVLLIAGAGLPRHPGYDMFLYINDIKGQVETNGPICLMDSARRSSPLTEARQYDLRPMLEELRDMALQRGIAVYALNPGRGEELGSSVEDHHVMNQSVGFGRMTNANSGFDVIAPPSGGLTFAGVPAEKALAQVASDLSSYYAVTYRSESIGDATIRTKNGQRVRATRAAGPMPPEERMRDAVLTHLRIPPATNELGIALTTEPPREAGTDRIVPLRVLIPISKLKIDPSGNEVRGGFTIFISTTNGTASTPVIKRTHEIRWPAEAMAAGQGKNMTYAVDVVMLSGFRSISVGVLDDRSEKTGFERISID